MENNNNTTDPCLQHTTILVPPQCDMHYYTKQQKRMNSLIASMQGNGTVTNGIHVGVEYKFTRRETTIVSETLQTQNTIPGTHVNTT